MILEKAIPPIRPMESHINKITQILSLGSRGRFSVDRVLKPEPALVYACDRKFTLSSAPIASAAWGGCCRAPRQLRSHLTIHVRVPRRKRKNSGSALMLTA